MKSLHVHAIPEIDHWSRPMQRNNGGISEHQCYFCKPSLYSPMPKGCTLCARCGVFMWTGKNDRANLAMDVCKQCDKELSTS